MDDQQTEPVPREDAHAPQPGPPPPQSATEPPPPQPPPPPERTAPPVGWVMPADVARPVIDIGSIIGRTFDTFGREWSLFLALAAPAALGSLVQVMIAPGATSATAAEPTIEDLLPMAVATGIGSLIAVLSTVMITVAADELWRGRPASVTAAVSGGLRVLPRYLGVILLLGLAIAAAALAAAALVLGARAGFAWAPGLLVLVGLLVVPLAVWIGARLTLMGPVIVLERHGVVGSLRRAWALSRGHALLLFVLSLAAGILSALPLWGASLFAAFVPDALVAGIALAIATLVSHPLPVIAMTIAWGDRVGGRHAESAVMARGRGRGVAALLLFGLGAILFMIGFGVAAQHAASAGPAFP